MTTPGFCKVCNADIEIEYCCDGYMCGCYGQPLEPPVCSEKCYNELMNNLDKYYPNRKTGSKLDQNENTQS